MDRNVVGGHHLHGLGHCFECASSRDKEPGRANDWLSSIFSVVHDFHECILCIHATINKYVCIIYSYIHIYIYTNMCVCVYPCKCKFTCTWIDIFVHVWIHLSIFVLSSSGYLYRRGFTSRRKHAVLQKQCNKLTVTLTSNQWAGQLVWHAAPLITPWAC